ncbi:hypothetical protein EBS67_18410, partial [bacterium]|nr:hypothetical protein [bacterium]
MTVDTKGRVTAGTNPTTLSGYGITDAQPLDANLTAIVGLSGTSGFLKKTGAGTWSLDTSTYVTSGSTPTFLGIVHIGDTSVSTATQALEIGEGRTGNGYAYLDLVGDATYTDFGLRLLRGNGGPNTWSIIDH